MAEIVNPWLTYEGTKVWRPTGMPAYTYVTSHVAIDADGAAQRLSP
jgi:hypothetical protein